MFVMAWIRRLLKFINVRTQAIQIESFWELYKKEFKNKTCILGQIFKSILPQEI